jgi:hypothetical protein
MEIQKVEEHAANRMPQLGAMEVLLSSSDMPMA